MDGRCYRAASPLLGADGQRGEPWTLLGNKLVQSGLYHTVVLIPAAVGGSSVRRWAAGGDLNAMLMAVISAVKARYTINAVLLDQGTTDFVERTPEGEYRSDLKSMIDSVRAQGVQARVSIAHPEWRAGLASTYPYSRTLPHAAARSHSAPVPLRGVSSP